MAETFTIAAAQSTITPDIAENGRHIRMLIDQAAQAGADLVLFPEGALSGYAKSQIRTWSGFDWPLLRRELDLICAQCAESGIYAVIGSAHPLGETNRPHNSLYIISDKGVLETRYDKRRLSHTEVTGWYTPGFEPVTFEIAGFRFGLAVCIEMQFPELFMEYEALGVDCVLFSSYGLGLAGNVLIQAHATSNCLWFGVSVPATEAAAGASGIVGPDGQWIDRCRPEDKAGIAAARLDASDERFTIALEKARPWRRAAREGDIYEERRVASSRSADRRRF
ncbi:carbon-nitrogen hydrolase family protein [Devosia nitrariae]|uniref:Amidohydrolase n=1 Tax=Devosia nitrariae TaxID=2071872 RepID=A0ABQ5W417_9HYPH|nr:carbon-nitrogen hydrolase family protein [Devosia nitrariae]GLQ54717.1 amidohydrolase [Devosia nitrariae]